MKNAMSRHITINVINTHDNIRHIVMIDRTMKIQDLKYVLSKRILNTPSNITLYTSIKMDDVYANDEIIGNNSRTMYMFVDYYDEPMKRYSWFRYYFCCGR